MRSSCVLRIPVWYSKGETLNNCCVQHILFHRTSNISSSFSSTPLINESITCTHGCVFLTRAAIGCFIHHILLILLKESSEKSCKINKNKSINKPQSPKNPIHEGVANLGERNGIWIGFFLVSKGFSRTWRETSLQKESFLCTFSKS